MRKAHVALGSAPWFGMKETGASRSMVAECVYRLFFAGWVSLPGVAGGMVVESAELVGVVSWRMAVVGR